MKRCHRKQKQVLCFPTKTLRGPASLPEQLKPSRKAPNHYTTLSPVPEAGLLETAREPCVWSLALGAADSGCQVQIPGHATSLPRHPGASCSKPAYNSFATNHPLSVLEMSNARSQEFVPCMQFPGALCHPPGWRLGSVMSSPICARSTWSYPPAG